MRKRKYYIYEIQNKYRVVIKEIREFQTFFFLNSFPIGQKPCVHATILDFWQQNHKTKNSFFFSLQNSKNEQKLLCDII